MLERLGLLATIILNLIDNPEEPKFRRVKGTGKKFSEVIGHS